MTGVGAGATILGDPEVGIPMMAYGGRISLVGKALKGYAGSDRDLASGAASGLTAILIATGPNVADVESAASLISEALGYGGEKAVDYASGSDPLLVRMGRRWREKMAFGEESKAFTRYRKITGWSGAIFLIFLVFLLLTRII